jgi:transposase
MTGQVLDLNEHLLNEHVTLVVMEATSDYWRPFYYLLEDEGLHVVLVSARDARNVPGPKTDVFRRCLARGSGRPRAGPGLLRARRRSVNCGT